MHLRTERQPIEKPRGTAWGVFQSWVEFADFHRALRDTGRQDPKRARLESIWVGRSAAMKQAALASIALQTGIRLAEAQARSNRLPLLLRSLSRRARRNGGATCCLSGC